MPEELEFELEERLLEAHWLAGGAEQAVGGDGGLQGLAGRGATQPWI